MSHAEGEKSASESQSSFELTEEALDLARQVYDEMRQSVYVAPGMVNQILRMGILTKKTLDGDRHYINNIQGSRNYYRDERPSTPGGSIIIHRDDSDPNVQPCPAFIHPPYGSQTQYKAEGGRNYCVSTTLSAVVKAAEVCGFCSIISQGVRSMQDDWIVAWARQNWIDALPERVSKQQFDEQPWFQHFASEINGTKQINESTISLFVNFPTGRPFVLVNVQLEAAPRSTNKRKRTLAILEFYTDAGSPSPWAMFGPSRHIHDYMLREESLVRVLEWIRNCQENHVTCNHKVKTGNPSRLLKLDFLDGPTDNEGEFPVHITLEETDANREYAYVAVSHCWAYSTPLKTTVENLDEHRKRVPWNKMSLGFRDVIAYSLSLDFRYIWIDSLCIVQQDKADWEREAHRMGMIYRNAAVVFALLGRDLSIRKSATRKIQDQIFPNDPPVYCRRMVEHRTISDAPVDVGRNSWFARAWCMQERINASRILYFGGTREEIMFECDTEIRCECDRVEKDQSLKVQFTNALQKALDFHGDGSDPISASKQALLWEIYIKLCEDYTARALTISTGRLPAIASITENFAPYFGRYFAGLWEYNFILGLQWEAFHTGMCSRQRQHATYVAPSFSWAARDGPVIWCYHRDYVPSPETHEFCEIFDVSCTTETYHLGIVTSGYLKLRCRVVMMEVVDKTWHAPDGRLEIRSIISGDATIATAAPPPPPEPEQNEEDEEETRCYLTVDAIEDWEDLQARSVITCIDLMRDRDDEYVSALALLPVERTEDGQGETYRRIGFSTMKKFHFDDHPHVIKEIHIV